MRFEPEIDMGAEPAEGGAEGFTGAVEGRVPCRERVPARDAGLELMLNNLGCPPPWAVELRDFSPTILLANAFLLMAKSLTPDGRLTAFGSASAMLR